MFGQSLELCANGVGVDIPVRQEMKLVRPLADATGSYIYSAAMSPTRPPADYTPRVIPYRAGIAVPLEDTRILWQR
jgi:glycogen phosphorylase